MDHDEKVALLKQKLQRLQSLKKALDHVQGAEVRSSGDGLNGRGDTSMNQQFANLGNNQVNEGPRQPTDKELFGHLVPSEEQVRQAEDSYENHHNNFYREVQQPIKQDERFLKKSGDIEENNVSFVDSLTPEQREQYEARTKAIDRKNVLK